MAKPPAKGKFNGLKTWWGKYYWPPSEYSRFPFCHNLEQKADELRVMNTAFSNLKNVRQLGLCMDSGSGWLEGPDVSDRAQLFRAKTRVFGSRKADIQDREKKYKGLWDGVMRSLGPNSELHVMTSQDLLPPAQCFFRTNQFGNFPIWTASRVNSYFDYESTVTLGLPNKDMERPLIFEGVDLAEKYKQSPHYPLLALSPHSAQGRVAQFCAAPIVPNSLTAAQKEWLMETEWAQRAFLSSYCMALSDNSQSFKIVDTLNIAKLPSKYVPTLQRTDIWDGLPNLKTLTILVAADFRAVHKNASGVVEDSGVQPSQAALPFYVLLRDFVAKIGTVKTLTVGYVGGGEHQIGIFGRNKNVLPAPIVDYNDEMAFTETYEALLALPFVEDLTFSNCWIAPLHLKPLAKSLSNATLRFLTLDSVSLSSHSGSGTTVDDLELEDEGKVKQTDHSGHRRFHDVNVPGIFYTQRPFDSDPTPGRNTDLWVHEKARNGSWSDIINTITPGPTLGFIRYAFQWCEEPRTLQKGGSLEVINFKSCGYVRLPNKRGLDQSHLPDIYNVTPPALYQRAIDLEFVMMSRKDDQLIGQICTEWRELEEITFITGFPMTIGWGSDEKKWDNIEDAQPVGGSGRFSGCVQKLAFDDRNAGKLADV